MPPLSPFSKSCVALAVSQLMLSSQASNATTIIVDSNADDNGAGCTLREAIVSANTNIDQGNGCAVGSLSGTDTITFNNSTLTSNTITLSTQSGGETYYASNATEQGGALSGYYYEGDSSLNISGKDIEINASSISGGITIDGGEAGAIMMVGGEGGESPTTLVLDNLTLTNGSNTFGGAMSVTSYNSFNVDVTLNNCTLSENYSSYDGGAVSVVSTDGGQADVTLYNTTVTKNSSGERGGAISAISFTYSDSGSSAVNVTLNNSSVTENHSKEEAGAFFVNAYSAFVDDDSSSSINVTLNNSEVAGNLSSSYGGAFFASTENGLEDSVTLALNNSNVTNNVAGYVESSGEGGSPFSFYSGGAIFAEGSGVSIALTSSTVSGNQAPFVGAIDIYAGPSLTITNSTISGNSAIEFYSAIRSYGEAYILDDGSEFSASSTALEGFIIGPIEPPVVPDIAFNRVEIINSTISNNVSKNENFGDPFNLSAAVSIVSGSLLITNSILANTDGESNCNFNYSNPDLLQVDSSSIIEGDFGGEGGPFGPPPLAAEGVAEGFISGASCEANRTGDPGLLDLADNNGALSHALSADSIARNSSAGTCELTDQAGQSRDVSDGFCDVGAVEFNPDFVASPTTPYVIRLPNGKVVVFDL